MTAAWIPAMVDEPPTVCELERVGREANVYFTARDLMAIDFPEPRWAVPGLVAEGLNILVGAPKLGKSWLCLGLAVAVASGGKALGKIDVEQGPVLYAALEDPPRRLQNRLSSVLGKDAVPEDLFITTSLPRLPDLVGYLAGWLDAHPTARLVIVDVLRKVRPLSDGKGNAYNEDYDTLTALKDLADKYGVAVVAVHHTRKAVDDSDVFNEVSGSTGLTGAADAVLLAKRARNTADAVLHITGRDVTEHDYGLTFDPSRCMWSLLEEPVAIATMGNTRRTILRHLEQHHGATPQEIAAATGLNVNTVKSNVRRMVDDHQLDTDGEGRYFPPLATPDATATGATRATQTGDGLQAATDLQPAEPQVSGHELQQLHGLQLHGDDQIAPVVNRLMQVRGGSWTAEGARAAAELALSRRRTHYDPNAVYHAIVDDPEKYGGER